MINAGLRMIDVRRSKIVAITEDAIYGEAYCWKDPVTGVLSGSMPWIASTLSLTRCNWAANLQVHTEQQSSGIYTLTGGKVTTIWNKQLTFGNETATNACYNVDEGPV